MYRMGYNYGRLTNRMVAYCDANNCGGSAKKAGLVYSSDFARIPHAILLSNVVSTAPPFMLCKCGSRNGPYHGGPQSYSKIHVTHSTMN